MFYVASPEILINKVFWLISCLSIWLFTANLEVLLKFFLFFIFAFGLSKLVVFAQIWALFLMSVNSELYWFLVGADTATSGSGKSETTGQKIFVAGRRRWCHHLAQCPSCLFSAFANQEADFKYPLLACSFHKFCTQNSANYFMSLMKCSVWFFSSSFFL